MFILLKKNKKRIITIFLSIFIIFILLNNNFEKNFKKAENTEKIEFDKNNFNIFLLNYKNYNENISLDNSLEKGILPRVAHAGGGFKEKIYTNSINALEANKKDFLFFEIDLFVTDDDKVVCEHDYNENIKTFKKFKKYINENELFKKCTYITLKKWLSENPKKIIITDFKNRNIDGLTFISKNFENYKNKFIPQIYHPNEYQKVKKLGFKNIIWTLYRYDKSNESVLLFANKMKLFAITMNPARARSGLPILLDKINVDTYVHTINSIKEYYKYVKIFKVDQIYTDWIK